MIQDIEIKNFRCFDETKISGFTRVNLIGGKNNSGKTALLEALYLYSLPIPESLLFLRQLRKESDTFSQAFPDQVWDYLFFNKRKDKDIIISGVFDGDILKELKLEYGNPSLTSKGYGLGLVVEFLLQGFIDCGYQFDLSLRSFINNYLNIYKEDQRVNNPLYDNLVKNLKTSQSSGSNDHDQLFHKYNNQVNKITIKFEYQIANPQKYAIFISSDQRPKNLELALKYDQAVLNNKTSEVLTLLKLIDDNIEEARTISLGEPTLYLKRYNESFLPLSMFGDALNRIVDIALSLINIPDGILLIDEIENGIHYLNQKEFWHNLFKISQAMNVQIFATTHSLEMIKAFADIGLEYYPEESAYFELARRPKNNQIIGMKREMETLDYALKYEQGVGLRGE